MIDTKFNDEIHRIYWRYQFEESKRWVLPHLLNLATRINVLCKNKKDVRVTIRIGSDVHQLGCDKQKRNLNIDLSEDNGFKHNWT